MSKAAGFDAITASNISLRTNRPEAAFREFPDTPERRFEITE